MSRKNWRNDLVLAFTLGCLVTLVLSIWGYQIYDYAKCVAGYSCEHYQGNSENGSEPEFWWALRWTLKAEDTFAQWVMMVFTIAAALLLWSTLKATKQNNVITREIGEAQVRAYLSFEIDRPVFEVQGSGVIVKIGLNGKIKNHGQSPALHPSMEAFLALVPRDYKHTVVGDEFFTTDKSAVAIPAAGTISQDVFNNVRYDRDLVEKGEHVLFFMYAITYTDVFGHRQEGDVVSGWVLDLLSEKPKIVWSNYTPREDK